MGWFGFGKKKGSAEAPANSAPGAPVLLARFLEQALTDQPGRVRVEDLLSAAAAVTGEALIRATGEFSPDQHKFVPGAAVLSDAINARLCGDQTAWEAMPAEALFAIVRDGALAAGYQLSDFPDPAAVIRLYLEKLPGPEHAQKRWGRPALSVPEGNEPRDMPLRYAYELRERVNALFEQLSVAVPSRPGVCAAALAIILGRVREAIEPSIALCLALETLNGMAKMAPMTRQHLEARGS